MNKKQINSSQKLHEKLLYLDAFAKKEGYSLRKIMGLSVSAYGKIKRGKDNPSKKSLKKVCVFFTFIKPNDLINDEVDIESKEITYSKVAHKFATLEKFIQKQAGISLARAIIVREGTIRKILDGEEMPSRKILKRICNYFFLDMKLLTDDELKLPEEKDMRYDNELADIQKDDPDTKFAFFKSKHYLSRNFKVLSLPRRFKLVFAIFIMMVPLLAYTGYCALLIVNERIDTVEKYKEGSEMEEIYDIYDEQQIEFHDILEKTSKEYYQENGGDEEPYYCEVKVGTELEKIKSISSATSSYETRLQLFFVFDKDEFRNMFVKYATTVLSDSIMDDYYATSADDTELALGRDATFTAFLANATYGSKHTTYFNNWIELNDQRYYPGETPSNVLTDKETMFDIGNGEFVADSYSTIKELEEITYTDESGNFKTQCYQKVKFNAKFEKAFDSVRYPLDSLQFKMYILPIMDSQYIRYTPNRDVIGTGEPVSGFAPYFAIGNGYRLVNETDEIKNFTLRVHYYQDVNNDPAVQYEHTYRTELEIVVRANRAGISLFLQAFINLFSVVIWIIIAFYNQSHNGEDSIGMLGTGLFGVISSMLVGLSMVSDAGIFSLVTMINIFTLAVIMIMTYQSITAKRAQVKMNKALIAYNGVKLRVMFYLLTLCTVIMFIGLPVIAYMFGL